MNYKKMSLSVIGNVYGRVEIDHVTRTSPFIVEEQGSIRERRWCVGQVVVLKQVQEKALEKKKKNVGSNYRF